MNFRNISMGVLTAISTSFSAAASIDVCSSPSELHVQKMQKYEMSEVPSLLHDCGLDAIFNASGIFDIFNDFKASIPSMDLLCGYSTKDITNWYGIPSDYKYDVGVEVGYDLNHDFLKGGDEFFSSFE